MRFQAEGNFAVIIRQAKLAEPKFAKPPAFDVVIEVEDAEGHKDWWRGEISQEYGKGNKSSQTQAHITMETLTKLGLPGNDLTQIGCLVNVQTEAWVTESKPNNEGKTFFNVRGLGGGGGEKIDEIDPGTLQARIAALFGQPAAAAVTQAAPPAAVPTAAPAAKANPFGAGSPAPARANPFSPK